MAFANHPETKITNIYKCERFQYFQIILKSPLTRLQRSLVVQLKIGILPQKYESDRYQGIAPETVSVNCAIWMCLKTNAISCFQSCTAYHSQKRPRTYQERTFWVWKTCHSKTNNDAYIRKHCRERFVYKVPFQRATKNKIYLTKINLSEKLFKKKLLLFMHCFFLFC